MKQRSQEEIAKKVSELMLGRLELQGLSSWLGVDLSQDTQFVRQQLESALNNRDANYVESLVGLAHRSGLSRSWASILGQLLLEDWHTRHEDIASALQEMQDPAMVETLYKATHLRLDYFIDDGDALFRKCIWALFDIGSEDARQKIAMIAKEGNEFIRGKAEEKLAQWGNAKHRKRQMDRLKLRL